MLGAVSAILGVMCDAVVELDDNLRVCRDAPTLAVMLLHGSSQSLQGKKFAQFLFSDEDRDRFAMHMRKSSVGPGSNAEAFHLLMRDSQGNKIPMEMFHICFNDSIMVKHLVGIREYGDLPTLLHPFQVPDPPSQVSAEIPSSNNNDVGVVRRSSHGELVTVSFDAFSLEVTSCSENFAPMFGGSPIGACVCDCLRSRKNREIWQWFENQMNSFDHSTKNYQRFNAGTVWISTSSFGKHQEFQAACAFAALKTVSSAEGVDDNVVEVVAELYDIMLVDTGPSCSDSGGGSVVGKRCSGSASREISDQCQYISL